MSTMKLPKNWVIIVLYAVMALFFLGAVLSAASTYSAVVNAQQVIALEQPHNTVQVLGNGSLEFRFNITLDNPARYALHMTSISWALTIPNGTAGPDVVIPLFTVYTGPTSFVDVPAKTKHVFSFEYVVYVRSQLSQIRGFINYSASQGSVYTVENAPYMNDFRLDALIGDFRHDYLGSNYLNELVSIELQYSKVAST